MEIISTHVSPCMDNPDYNCGDYEVNIDTVCDGLYSAEVRSQTRWNRTMLMAWGYTNTQTDAEELGKSLEDIARMRYDLMERQRGNERSGQLGD